MGVPIDMGMSSRRRPQRSRDDVMRVFSVSLFVAAVIAIGSALVLDEFQEPAAVAFATSAARI
jgi:hypothetical protein